VRPLAQSDGHDAPGLIDELIPGRAAMVDEIVVRFEDAVGEPVVAHELPNVFDRIEFRAFRRQRNDADVGRNDEAPRQVPASLVDQEDGMGSGRDCFGDLREMQVHRLAVAGRQDQGRALAFLGADRAEDIGGSGPLVARRAGAGATLGPAARDFVLLADAGLVGEPDFYRVAVDALRTRDRLQTGGEVFLKFSIASAACAWWRGRAESLR
jgi:hypothetical protein